MRVVKTVVFSICFVVWALAALTIVALDYHMSKGQAVIAALLTTALLFAFVKETQENE